MIDDSINRQSSRRMNIQLFCNVLPVSNHGVKRQMQFVSNFFVNQPFNDHRQHFFFAFAQLFLCFSLRSVFCSFSLAVFVSLQCRPQNIVFYCTMSFQFFLYLIDTKQYICHQLVGKWIGGLGREVFDDKINQFV